MTRFRKFLAVCLSVSTLAVGMTAATPASAQWGWGGGWGGGWGPGWGYGGYNNGGAIAGAAIGGLALGALAGAAISQSQQNQYAQPYYAAPRRGRLCGAWQPIYDDWGNFLQYRRVKVAC